MTYYESAEGEKITKARAIQEVNRHGCNVAEMFTDIGERDTYDAQEVLDWLGY
jgi:hypothetical protein